MSKGKWTETTIISGIQEVIDELELDRMPSFKEIKTYYQNCALTNAISKNEGIYYYANLMGYEIKDSETAFGKRAETEVSEMLIADGYDVTKMSQNFPYDLLVNNAVKIDVKASKLYHTDTAAFYTFNLEKPYCTCDLYVFKTVSDDEVCRFYIIPSCHIFNKTQISIGEHKSIYYKYENRWDYIEQYSSFMSEVV